MRAGRTVMSPQTGLPIEFPGTEVARLVVQQQFGEDVVTEGSICSVKAGTIHGRDFAGLYVVEAKESE